MCFSRQLQRTLGKDPPPGVRKVSLSLWLENTCFSGALELAQERRDPSNNRTGQREGISGRVPEGAWAWGPATRTSLAGCLRPPVLELAERTGLVGPGQVREATVCVF